MINFTERVERVSSKDTLVKLVQDLREDLRSSPENWENTTLDSFLEALAAWTADMDGYYLNQGGTPPEQPTWKTVAEMLLAARTYE
jgi:hypothetical protein